MKIFMNAETYMKITYVVLELCWMFDYLTNILCDMLAFQNCFVKVFM